MQRITRTKELCPAASICVGFAANISIFIIIYIIISRLGGGITSLSFTYLAVTAGFFIISLFVFLKKGGFSSYKSDSNRFFLKSPFFYLLIALIFVFTAINCYLQSSDPDDSYFISIINSVVETGALREGVSYFGWESWISIVSRITTIHPAALVHSYLPLLFTPLCFLAHFILSKKLFSNPKKSLMFMFFMLFLNLFGGNGDRPLSSFMMLFSWRGEALMACFVFPVIICICVEVYRTSASLFSWLSLCFVLAFGSGISATGKYLVPFFMLICFIPYFISLIVKKKYKTCLKVIASILLSLLLSALPMIDSAFMPPLSGNDSIYYSGQIIPDWGNVFGGTLVFSSYFVIFILAYLFNLFYEKDNALRLLFGGMIPLVFITLLNPILIPLTTRYITGTAAYSLIFLMLPVYIMTAYILTTYSLIFARIKLNLFMGIIMFLILGLAGRFIYLPGVFFTPHINEYHIPGEVFAACETILEDTDESAVCVFPDDIEYFPAQITSRITVPRDTYYSNWNSLPSKALKARGVDYLYVREDSYSGEYEVLPVDGFGYVVKL